MPTELHNLTKVLNNGIFRIPDYQRGYAWTERQLSDFWSDLMRARHDRYHYCGQLTLEKADKSVWSQWGDDQWIVDDAGYEAYLVVDGQQRLTTAIILLQCLLQDLSADAMLTGQTVEVLRERFLAKSKGLLRTCLFGYAKDNPSHEFFRTQILGIPSNHYEGIRTVYTTNLGNAKKYFEKQIKKLKDMNEREQVLKALVQRFRFNLHELSDDIDVFVAFETMNNRGKSLSRLELLKNRLIYLSTLAHGEQAEREKVRSTINAVWRTVYEELGRNQNESLDDDEFLRAHWIVYFGYDKEEADPLTQFLLNKHFTTERLDSGALQLAHIQKYADSLQVSARIWQQLNFPENHEAQLGSELAPLLQRLKRLGFGVLRPLLLAALSCKGQEAQLKQLLVQADRFLLLVRSFARTRSDVAEADSYRMAHALHDGTTVVASAAAMLSDRVAKHFSLQDFQAEVDDLFEEVDDQGFYDLPALKYFLFEYEDYLRQQAKSASGKISWAGFRGERNSAEHIYPQRPEAGAWPTFEALPNDQKKFLLHSLGNLVAVSVAKNAALSRKSFNDKKVGTAQIPGFSQGSFSELQVAQNADWTPKEILERGLQMLKFLETRWQVTLGSDAEKIALLKLDFVK